jgi:CRP-like cAMP-binding protein
VAPQRRSPKKDPAPSEDRRGNLILDALPAGERDRLVGVMDEQRVELKQPLMEAGQRIRNTYFPLTAVASLLTLMDDGTSVEIATVGNEGMVGAPVLLGVDTLSDRDLAQVQVPGTVLSLDTAAFREETQDGSAFRGAVERYVQAYLRQVSQQVACNGLHSVVERCSRWILLTHDRVGQDEFPLTQEFLSQMLGVRRASVTVAAGTLQQAGFIQFNRGRVRVLDRRGLEDSSCECYAIIRQEFKRLVNSGDGAPER